MTTVPLKGDHLGLLFLGGECNKAVNVVLPLSTREVGQCIGQLSSARPSIMKWTAAPQKGVKVLVCLFFFFFFVGRGGGGGSGSMGHHSEPLRWRLERVIGFST